MPHKQIIGKCCYCGRKALIIRRISNCDTCGAAITKFASLDAIKSRNEKPALAGYKRRHSSKPEKIFKSKAKPRYKFTPNRKTRKSSMKQFFDFVEDFFDDFFEDIIEDIVDIFD